MYFGTKKIISYISLGIYFQVEYFRSKFHVKFESGAGGDSD